MEASGGLRDWADSAVMNSQVLFPSMPGPEELAQGKGPVQACKCDSMLPQGEAGLMRSLELINKTSCRFGAWLHSPMQLNFFPFVKIQFLLLSNVPGFLKRSSPTACFG